MTEEMKSIFKLLAFFVAGFIVNYGMTRLAAPGYGGTALATGFFLTAFGIALAVSAMHLVMLPLGILKLIRQLSRGEKPLKQNPQNDRLDRIGRILFVFLYTLLCTLTGAFVGALTGGMGLLSTAAMFTLAGILLSLFAPMELLWNSGAETGGAGLDQSQKADIEQARQQGDPSILLVDKVSSRIVDALIERPPGTGKTGQR